MAHLLSDLAHYFKLDETNIDNWTFKLFYKGSSVICMLGATVGIATQYFGDPIRYPSPCQIQSTSFFSAASSRASTLTWRRTTAGSMAPPTSPRSTSPT